jgi:phage protein U
MAIGSYGPLVFEVNTNKVFTPKIKRTAGSSWANHDLISRKPKSQYLGPKLKSGSLDIVLRAELGVKPRATLEMLAALAEGRQVYYLIVGGKPLADNPCKITEISETWGEMYSGGELFAASVNIKYEEYAL